MGAAHSGKSFKLMSIDVHTLEGGKMVRTYHIEDWLGAVRQLSRTNLSPASWKVQRLSRMAPMRSRTVK